MTDHVSTWKPESSPRRQAVMGKLTEEAGELQAILGRCQAQGLDQSSPDDGTPNREALEDEIADTVALCLVTISFLGLNDKRINDRCRVKIGKKTEWLMQVPQ